MLTFDNSQLRHFAAADTECFEDQMARLVADEFADDYSTTDAGRALVDHANGIAKARGITDRASLRGLIMLMGEFGTGFERTPDGAWGRGVLDHPGLPPEAKVPLIRKKFDASTGGRKLVRVR